MSIVAISFAKISISYLAELETDMTVVILTLQIFEAENVYECSNNWLNLELRNRRCQGENNRTIQYL
jgi:hypothetical protein